MRDWRVVLAGLALALLCGGSGWAAYEDNPAAPCLACHETVTPGIVHQWEQSKHSKVNIKCYICHKAKEGDPSGYEHNGFYITAVPSPKYCESCHPAEVEQNARSKHAWGAFLGPLKPYYKAARDKGLDPMSQETAAKLDPERMAKTTVSPLFPDSSILKKIGLLDNADYNHNNVNLGCMECHGSFIRVGKNGQLDGWPNAGVGRINPDGSLGSCTYCHPRHTFSVAEARKPETCGQCHLGPDHPQHEIYEESKHGNIYAASGEEWNWDVPPGQWGPRDIVAPTCATCHMSGFGGAVETTHDVGDRLYWELQPKKSVPQWKGPEEVDFVLERIPDEKKAAAGRQKMKTVCYQCHSRQWADNYFDEFDQVVSDYNMLWDYTDGLLQQAYEEGLISKDLPLDETPEIMHYLVWHHDGRRWRMGASMMGPDWTHWNGAVDAIMNKLGTMINDIEMRRRLKELED
ncbi:MAG: hydroxylamine oxidoreductase [Desulfuromonadales bacterium]|nr:hydroxylamine oxidoreductase [Desulfuromonadales bacterium]NIS44160.1 hydroxylamine oxidoreductase [Desulfuromonadales bacterium]